MNVGIISENKKFVPDTCAGYGIYNFSISADETSFFKLFDAAFGTPSRYVMEVFRRIKKVSHNSEATLIFNPLFSLSVDCIVSVLQDAVSRPTCPGPLVLSDATNRPLAYYLPGWIAAEEDKYFCLLSATKSELDCALLSEIFNVESEVVKLSVPVQWVGNGFYCNEYLFSIYECLSARSLKLLRTVLDQKGTSLGHHLSYPDNQRNALRDSIGFTAFMPYHAGDALFYALAAAYSPDSHVKEIILDKRYMAILKDVLPEYRTAPLDFSPPNREGNAITDEEYFISVADRLHPFRFYYYCRPSRNYNVTNSHLIDHFAFAIGNSLINKNEFISAVKATPPLPCRLDPIEPYRIILHFDAGWGLKVYPPHFQEELLRVLLEAGIKVTVLGTEDADCGSYKKVTFKNLEQYKEMLSTHHLLVGSDSFPSHYAAHVFGLPTICLFGPTKPVNSNATASTAYTCLENGLDCKPCLQASTCPERKDNFCHNFVPPDMVVAEIYSMLKKNYELNS